MALKKRAYISAMFITITATSLSACNDKSASSTRATPPTAGSSASSPVPSVTSPAQAEGVAPKHMTLAIYNKIQEGMTEAEFHALLAPGACEKGPLSGVSGPDNVTWVCKADDGVGLASITITRGKVSAKAHLGLK